MATEIENRDRILATAAALLTNPSNIRVEASCYLFNGEQVCGIERRRSGIGGGVLVAGARARRRGSRRAKLILM
jgi:hypothetical protein